MPSITYSTVHEEEHQGSRDDSTLQCILCLCSLHSLQLNLATKINPSAHSDVYSHPRQAMAPIDNPDTPNATGGSNYSA